MLGAVRDGGRGRIGRFAPWAGLALTRWSWAVAVATMAVASGNACIDAGTFACERDSQCEWNGQPGLCLDPGYCAVVDPRCDSGYRFHGRASGELAGECADLPSPTTGSSTVASTAVDPTTSTSTSGPGTGGQTEGQTEGQTDTTGDGLDACEGNACACAASVATGIAHTCVARTDGVVVCWGDNAAGQLGMGEGAAADPTPHLRYPALDADVQIVQLFGGNNHVCGTTAEGRLLCWGQNNSMQADPGVEVVMDEQPPVGPSELDFAGTVTRVGMAPSHTCATGPVEATTTCWGANGFGELASLDPPPGPYVGPPLGVDPIAELAAGRDHTCVLVDGRALCWGRNNLGQLGNPAVTDQTIDAQAVLLDRPPVAMAAGRDHTCVVVTDGSLRCWGSNAVGQIGDGSTVNAVTPVTPAGPAERVIDLSARLDTTCALTEVGELWCWGDAFGGSLGTDVDDGTVVATPTRVSVADELPEPIVEFDVGRFHVCARAASGRLWCWGSDEFEQLGPTDPPDGKNAVEMNLDCPT